MVDEAWVLAAGKAFSCLPDLQKSKLRRGKEKNYEIQNLCFSFVQILWLPPFIKLCWYLSEADMLNKYSTGMLGRE